MKRTLLISLLFISFNGFSQISHIDTLLAPKGKIVYDTTYYLTVQGTYLIRIDSTTIGFDSSKVGISLSKNAAGDSIRLISGSGTPLSTIKDRGGVDSIWRTLGQDSIKFSIDGRLRSIKDSSGGGSSGWGLTGNAGTTAGTNFVGTTDDIDLQFKRNSVFSALIDSSSANNGHTSFGFGALANLTQTTTGTTAFGYKALNAFTTGGSNTSQNTAIGNRALLVLTTGLRNTAVGYDALKATVTSNDNASLGYNTLTLSTTSDNTAIGSGALAGQTTGNGNTAVGKNAISTATDGINNTAIGNGAGPNLKGFGNVAIGYGILTAAVSGATNFVIGYGSTMNANTSGASNVVIGRDAMVSNISGSNTVSLGTRSGNASTGGGNIFLGYYAGSYLTSEANTIVIGSLDRTTRAKDTTDAVFVSTQSTTVANQRTKIGGGGTVGVNQYGHSTLAVNGSFAIGYVAKTANYTATINDASIVFTSGTDTLTLPTAVGCAGRQYEIKNLTGNTAQVATTSSQTIDGAAAPFAVLTTKCYGFRSDGANWYIIYVF